LRVYAARWLVPVTSPPVENGCVAVADSGEIAFAGHADGAPSGELRDLGNAILTPGLINAHTHLDLTALRGAIPEAEFFNWIRTLVALKAEHLDAARLHASSCAGIAEGIRAGVTTFGDTSDSLEPARAMNDMHVRGVAFQEVFAPDPGQCAQAIAGVRARIEDAFGLGMPLVRAGISPHAPYTVSDDLYRAAAALARELDVPMAVHIAESAEETAYVCNGGGPFAEFLKGRGITVLPRSASPLQLLADLGVLECAPLLIHAVRLSDGDVDLIARNESPVVHCPISNSRFGHGVAPLPRLLDAGVTLALGSDSVIANDRMDMLEEARVAVLLQRAIGRRSDLLAAPQLLEMLTIGGARALGMESIVGSLEAGKRADLTAFRCDDSSASDAASPERALVHSLSGRDTTMVMVDGRELLRDGRLLHDVSAALRSVGATGREIALVRRRPAT
jgi:5-methylthioadenosine/S-adenosylhomocysteine deaminase